MKRFSQYLLSGIVTIIPLWVTWLVVEFVFRKLLAIGRPIVGSLRQVLSHLSPELASHVSWRIADNILAVVLTLAMFYGLGWAANHVFGRRLINLLDRFVTSVPLIKTVYGGVRKLITTLKGKPGEHQRVVLINFPSEQMKTVGFLTRTMTEKETGRTLAIVYVPTTPNPTSGYIEIVPMEQVVATDWTVDEAMNFIVSAGAIAPERAVQYSTRMTQSAA